MKPYLWVSLVKRAVTSNTRLLMVPRKIPLGSCYTDLGYEKGLDTEPRGRHPELHVGWWNDRGPNRNNSREKRDLHKGGFTSKFYSNPTLIIMQEPTHKREGVNSSTHNTQQPFGFLTELQSVNPLPTSLE